MTNFVKYKQKKEAKQQLKELKDLYKFVFSIVQKIDSSKYKKFVPVKNIKNAISYHLEFIKLALNKLEEYVKEKD